MEYYFFRGYTYESIVKLLAKQYDILISERTLKCRLQSYGLRRRLPNYDLAQVRRRIAHELDGPGCMGGYRSIWHTLRFEGLQVPRRVVATVVRELDPEGCEMRRGKRMRRRNYSVPGPNYCWHIDGYDKLKPFGFPIHGCINGWSRRIMWLQVARSNNNPEVPAENFLQCVAECGGCPVKVRSDCGTENGILAAIQCEFRGSADAHAFGSSPANQRIEGWWSFYQRNRSTWWINYFKDLIEKDLFHPGSQLEEEALWYCFSRILQKDLDLVREHWNTHHIRDSKHDGAMQHGKSPRALSWEILFCTGEIFLYWEKNFCTGEIFLYWEKYFCTGKNIFVLGEIFLYWEKYFCTGRNIFLYWEKHFCTGRNILNWEKYFCTAPVGHRKYINPITKSQNTVGLRNNS